MVPVGHVRMSSTGVRAPVWTASGMGHWKRVIKIAGGTDCYYCINDMTWTWLAWYMFSYTCYCSWSFIRYRVTCILITVSVSCYTFCDGILRMFHSTSILFPVFLADIVTVYARHRMMVILYMLTCMFILHMPTCMFIYITTIFISITSPLDNIIYYINWTRL